MIRSLVILFTVSGRKGVVQFEAHLLGADLEYKTKDNRKTSKMLFIFWYTIEKYK